MDIKPDESQVAAVIAANPHRHPDRASLKVIGDRGAEVRLPIVIAHPTGACVMPDGKKPSPTWGAFVASLLGFIKAPDGMERQAALDCLLWPDVQTWAQWAARWPAIDARVWRAAKLKAGADLSIIDEPEFSEALPDAVKACCASYPQASLRRFTPKSPKQQYSLLCVIDSPSPSAWSFFNEAMKKPAADAWGMSCDLAQATCRLFYDENEGKEIPFSSVKDRWPGIIVLSNLTAAVLAGAAADVELGE